MSGFPGISVIPWGRVGIAVGILAMTALFAAFKIEERRADKLDKQLTSYRVALGQARSEAGRLKAEGIRIANEEKARHEKELARIRSDADVLRLRGPGKASCLAPAAPASSGGKSAPSGSAPMAPVSDGEGQQLIGLPFDPTVALGRNHDALRAEVIAWRNWYAELSATWGKK